MFERVLIANRGEIACRIIRTCRALGIRSIAVYSDVDSESRHVSEADSSVLIGPGNAAESYLCAERILEAAQQEDAEAIHPGYGFLSESADFAQLVGQAGVTWIGPGVDAMRVMADKINAKRLMQTAGVPVAPGTGSRLASLDEAALCARDIGYPVMLKAAAGGGGVGMEIIADEDQLRRTYDRAATQAARIFGDGALLLEQYVADARHVEVQIVGVGDGTVMALGDRDCSVQRRHQKVAEETPSPGVHSRVRDELCEAAVRAGEAVNYVGAGTVEFLVSNVAGAQTFTFLEMNTRLQVEHPVTELVTGLDLVELQLRIAAGEPVYDLLKTANRSGNALELRVYAEDPVRFLPGPGRISRWVEPTGSGVRVDSGYSVGDLVTPFYDPLLAKLCVWGPDREIMLARARIAVDEFRIEGPKVNLQFLERLLRDESFCSGKYDTGLIRKMSAST